jgi:hypothetical protein
MSKPTYPDNRRQTRASRRDRQARRSRNPFLSRSAEAGGADPITDVLSQGRQADLKEGA